MTAIAYIDTVSTAAPVHSKGPDKKPWEAHAMRIAIALEKDREIVGTLLALVEQPEGVALDRDWCRRYGIADNLPGDEGEHISVVANNASVLLGAAKVFVAQSAAFHRDVLSGLLQDAQMEGAREWAPWYDTMHEANAIVGAVNALGRRKAPNITESYKFFTGETLPLIATLPWRLGALSQLNAVRTVYWGLQGWGRPEQPIGDPAVGG